MCWKSWSKQKKNTEKSIKKKFTQTPLNNAKLEEVNSS